MVVKVDSKILKEVVSVFNKAGIELIKIYTDEEYLNILGIDRAYLIAVGANIRVEENDEEFEEVIVNVEQLYKAIKNMNDVITIKDDDSKLIVNDSTFKIGLPIYDSDIDLIFKTFEEVLVNLDVQFSISIDTLKKIIKALKTFKFDTFRIEVKDGYAKILSNDEEVSYEAIVEEAYPEGEGSAVYSVSMLAPMSLIKDSEILFKFAQGKPLVVDIAGDEYSMFYMIAPRVDEV